MKPQLVNFTVKPSVVKADCETEIQITSRDALMVFHDDVTYKITFIPMEDSDVPLDDEMTLLGYEKSRTTFSVKPQNGVIKIKYFFKGEQEWKINLRTDDYDKHINPLYDKYKGHWDGLKRYLTNGVELSVYSLKDDLYCKKPMRGDLHIHTSYSDGREAPAMVAAQYRRAGYDFIAVTDHNVYGTADEAIKKFDFKSDFKILTGEEIHNGYVGYFHMVNIGNQYSVNDIYLNNPEKIEKEVKELEKETAVPEGLDKKEYLNRVWLYREAKKSGGFVVYPHPYWQVGKKYHTETKMSKAIIKNGLCDAFEALGGCSPSDNNLQIALYNELRAEGVNIPVVGSTDCHSVLNQGYFKAASTIAFVDNGEIIDAISNNLSVAVEHLEGENVRVYGPFRLVKYARFLLENYFPVHNALCEASGQLITDYICGQGDKAIVETLEKRVGDFEKVFFGL